MLKSPAEVEIRNENNAHIEESQREVEISKANDDSYFRKSDVVGIFSDLHPLDYNGKAYLTQIMELPTYSAEKQTEEYCDTCKEYDTENHYCHRFSRVIKDTLNDKVDSVLEDIKAEIIKNIENTKDYEDEALFNSGLKFALEIIDRHISRKE